MLDSLYLRLADLSPAALIIIPLAIMFFCAFGMTRITKRLSEYNGEDRAVRKLAGKLLATEQQNIDQMKQFLS